MRTWPWALAALLLAAPPALAHDAHDHGRPAALPEVQPAVAERQDPLPIEIVIDDRFALVDHTGRSRGPELFQEKPALLFFGYANCDGVCLTGVPAIAEAAHDLARQGLEVRPILVTIDPANDTPAALAAALAPLHPGYLGLTGSEAALQQARLVFNVKATATGTTKSGQTVFQHGTFVYLIGADGQLLTLFPPVLPPAEMARIARRYLAL